MTNDELRAFKTLFSKYCHAEMGKGHCNGEECEWCPINKAYEEVERFEKLDSHVNVHIYDIKWDMGGETVDFLPTEVDHTFDGYNDIADEDLMDEISDWLSDEYGYCHFGFQIREDKGVSE